MIVLHSLQGEPFAINAELIERVEGSPESRVTLVTGTTYIAVEGLDQVITLVRRDRAQVEAMAMRMAADPVEAHDPELHLVPAHPTTEGEDR
ncbi:MAG TPA: flagellar FlbD family protein [Acidimicrobiales bacterium]|nr:flagellar FlbD family protein [Acidimicrobiales bacterium]